MKLLHIIADYDSGDLAVAEMISALSYAIPSDWQWHFTAVASFDTLGTGFCVGQLGLHEKMLRPEQMLLYANCAPRLDRGIIERMDNEGEELVYGVLKNGVRILVVNAGHSLSFVAHQLSELWNVQIPKGGSQFRSRDFFPPIVGRIASGDVTFSKAPLPLPYSKIPAVPTGVVAYRDSFGNLKTTYRTGDPELQELRDGEEIYLEVGNRRHPAFVTTGSFNVKQGYVAFSPGSSGHSQRFWEIFKRGDSAWKAFGRPSSGTRIKIMRLQTL